VRFRARFFAICAASFAVVSAGTDPNCPACPASQRGRVSISEARLKEFRAYSASRPRASGPHAAVALAASGNLADQYIFGKMQADGVIPAPASGDEEFLRRIYLDLTGRIPTVDQTLDFLGSTDLGKRSALIETLLASDTYVDRWTQFYGEIFQVTSAYYQFVSVQSRNRFYQYLREFVANDRSWANVARELITAGGDSFLTGPPNFIVRGLQQNEPIQDTWDTLTDNTSIAFLGLKTLCISCHDGRGHLEQINLFLAPRRRTQFWQMAAFFSRMNMAQVPVDTFSRQIRSVITDRTAGGYSSWVDPNNPGPRPARIGGPYDPVFMLTDDAAPTGRYRSDLAQLVVANRQFSRAAVNYLWSAMFTTGIVARATAS
jgi:hypothetical protein